MKDDFVSFEVARLLKQVGFKEPCNRFIELSRDGSEDKYECKNRWNWNADSNSYSRPSQNLAAKWLRKVYNTYVIVTVEAYPDGVNYLYQVLVYNSKAPNCWSDRSTGVYGDNGEYKTYKKAMEAGLKRALEMIIEFYG